MNGKSEKKNNIDDDIIFCNVTPIEIGTRFYFL